MLSGLPVEVEERVTMQLKKPRSEVILLLQQRQGVEADDTLKLSKYALSSLQQRDLLTVWFLAELSEVDIRLVSSVYPTGYGIDEVVNHRAVVFIPSAMASHTFAEIYSMGIPIYVPSMKFFQQNGFGERGRENKYAYEQKLNTDACRPWHQKLF